MTNLTIVESHQSINQSSGEVEYYTPEDIIELARKVLGEFDLDPASSAEANKVVKAKVFYTAEDDGLSYEWFGKVWMNHPFRKGEKVCRTICKKKNCKPYKPGEKPTRGHCITEDILGNIIWTTHLHDEYVKGNVEEAICITFSSMSEAWMVPLLKRPQCFPKGRINYRNADGNTVKGVTKGSVISYFGKNVALFAKVFSSIGTIKIAI